MSKQSIENYRKAESSPVLFLHGFMGNEFDWQSIIDNLNSQKCIAIDLPGHGSNSKKSILTKLDFQKISLEIHSLIKKMGYRQVHFVGYSMGGRIALYTALRFPSLVKTLTLESTSPGIKDKKDRENRIEIDKKRGDYILKEGIEQFVEDWYQLELFKSLHRNPTILKNLKTKRKQNSPEWMAKIITELSPGVQPSQWDTLSQLTMPVCIISGKLDKKYSDIALKVHNKILNSELHIVPNAGHMVHLEAPKDFTKIIDGFFQKFG